MGRTRITNVGLREDGTWGEVAKEKKKIPKRVRGKGGVGPGGFKIFPGESTTFKPYIHRSSKNRFPIYYLGPEGTYSSIAAEKLKTRLTNFDRGIFDYFSLEMRLKFSEIHDSLAGRQGFALFPHYNSITGTIDVPKRGRKSNFHAVDNSGFPIEVEINHYGYSNAGNRDFHNFDSITEPFMLRLHPAVKEQCTDLVNELLKHDMCEGEKVMSSSVQGINTLISPTNERFDDNYATITFGPLVDVQDNYISRSSRTVANNDENVTTFGIFSTKSYKRKSGETPEVITPQRISNFAEANKYLHYVASRMNQN